MADKLIFPIGFDLSGAVKQASNEWESKYAGALERALQKRSIPINISLSKSGIDSIESVKKRLAELRLEPITPETKTAIRQLASELQSLARALEAVQKYSKRVGGTTEAVRNSKIELNEQKAAAARELARQRAARAALAETKLALARDRATNAAERGAKSTRSASQAFQEQESYISRLTKRLAVYASFRGFGGFLTSIRDVTAEFELQRVSLGAIIQDQQRANELFSEIKAFALKSPLKILDLTKYTKQVAAYRIEQDKLFDTTRRLADVSVGLGVDMGRIVLAYGQVKAASYLRAAEIRQFTEAGIPMLELLAEKFSELSGTVVSTEEVMDKVSKRMVAFSMVEEIFEDMTSAGGMFYNMQEKQSLTLYGMWAKMGDAAAVMYEQMGNTAVANSAMKDTIQLLSEMMLHWTALANVAQTAVIGFGLYKAALAGMIPLYALQTKLTVNQIKAEKAKYASALQMMTIGRQWTRQEQFAIASKNKLMAADYKRLIIEGKLSDAQKISLGRQAATNVQLRRAVLEMGLFTKAQIKALGAMNGWQFFWAKFKLQIASIGQAFVNLGRSMMAFLPLAVLTAITDLFMDWRNAVAAQKEAIKKVDKQYEEMKVTLMEIKNAYDDIKNATRAAGVSEDEFIKTSYSQKLEQLKKVIKLLGNFGMKNVIDPSVLNYTNIDPVLDRWLAKLNEVNELARGWGREVALVSNAYEGNIFGWSIFGENLKEDMKDLERSWTKLTVNSEFNQSLSQLRVIVGNLANDNKAVYDNISKAIGADLKLALGQKRRNESELQYQQRIYKNYQNIESYLQAYLKKGDYKGMLPSLSSADAGGVLADFQKDVDEVMHEFDKVKEKFRNQDALSVKMAIDTIAAENDWTEWQKELLIQHLNEDPITLNAEIIPTGNIAGQGAVAEGLKAIITSEYPTLFNENELQSLVSAEGIVDAIKSKLDASNESLEKTMQLQNNLAYGSKGFENSLERVKALQKEISEIENMRAELQALDEKNGNLTSDGLLRRSELQAKLQEVDEQSLNTKRAQIAAIVEANAKYDEQIQKQRESANAEREIAKAALERVTSMGLSDLGKDVKEQFAGLRVDADKAINDNNYSTDFLISDDELKKVRDVGDLYETWAKNTKAIKDEKEKLVGVGISEATIEKDRAALEAKRASVQAGLADLERQMTDEKYSAQLAEYESLKYALATATTADAKVKAESDLQRYLGDTKNAEFAILMMKKEGLKTTIQETLVSQAANDQIADYIKGLEEADKLWKELGKRYNFKVPDKDSERGSGEDPWILLMKNRMKFMQDFQKGVEDLSKWMGYTKGLADEQENMLGRGLSLKIDSRELDGTKEELIKWYEDSISEIRKMIVKLGGKEWEGLGVQMILAKDTKSRVLKKYQELLADMFKQLTDFRTEQTQNALEAKIKELSDKVSHTKTAKGFYEKILKQTGDVELAANVTVSIYGQRGDSLQKQLDEQIVQLFGDYEISLPKIKGTDRIDYLGVKDLAKQALDLKQIGTETYDQIIKIADSGQADLAKIAEQGAKLLLTYDEIAQKRVNIEQEASEKIRQLREAEALYLASAASAEDKASYSSRTNRAVKGIESDRDLNLLKLKDEYLRFFSAIHSLTKKEAGTLRDEVRQALFKAFQDGAISADDLKRELKAIDDQFNKLIHDQGEFVSYLDGGFEGVINRLRGMSDEMMSMGSEIFKMDSVDQISSGQRSFIDKMLNQFGNESTGKSFDELVSNTNGDLQQMGGLLQGISGQMGTMATKALSAFGIVDAIITNVGRTIDGVAAIRDQLNEIRSDSNQLEGGFWDAFEYIENFNKYAMQAWESLKSGNLVGAVQNTAQSIISIFGTAQAQKVKKLNKEIERQQEVLDRLEYTYSRLEVAAEKALGADYVSNIRQQSRLLSAEAEAYRKQLDAEKRKGKGADADRIREYEEAARDAADAIADLEGTIAEKLLGSDLSGAARDFAQAWLDAYKEFGSTTDAMGDKFQEMIENMVVESALAKVMERALEPMFNMIDTASSEDFYNEDFWRKVVAEAEKGTSAANYGAQTMMNYLEKAGISVRSLGGELTGISRDIANASEEQITGLAAGINTQNFFMSRVPDIAVDVAAIRARLDSVTGGVVIDQFVGLEWEDWQNQALGHLAAVSSNTKETVVQCTQILEQCTAIASDIHRVVVSRGAPSSFGIQTFLS